MNAPAKVLVVEDDQDLAEAVSEALHDAGFAVVTAAHGAAAMQTLKRSRSLPQLILLDLMMPVQNGQQFIAEMRRDPRLEHLPVVLLTADGGVEQEVVTLKAAAGLRKPVRLDTLVATVEKFCRTD